MLLRFVLATFFALWAFSVKAEAEITMIVDTSAQTFSFSGSDTGTPQDDVVSESIIWEFIHDSIPGSPVAETNFSGFSPDSHWDEMNFIRIVNEPDFETLFSINLSSTTGPFGTISVTPNTAAYDYSAFSTEQVTILTDLVAEGSIPIGFFTSGASGFSAISVQSATAVPEPNSCALFLGFAMFGTIVRRRSV